MQDFAAFRPCTEIRRDRAVDQRHHVLGGIEVKTYASGRVFLGFDRDRFGLCGGHPEYFFDDFVDFRVVRSGPVARFGQIADGQHDPAAAVKVPQLEQRFVAQSANVFDQEYLVALTADVQRFVFDIGLHQRAIVDQVVIQSGVAQLHDVREIVLIVVGLVR